MSIQSSINSIVSSVGQGAFAVKHLQQQKAMSTPKLANDTAKQQKAQTQMEVQKEAKKTQRRNFMDYLSKQPTSLGGTVGDLPKPLQRQIASQYNKSQRKTMMDRMDKEAKNGK